MAARTWRTRGAWRIGAVLFTILMEVVNGYDDIYTISQLSPKSVSYESPEKILKTSKTENTISIEPSVHYYDNENEVESTVNDITPEYEDHVIVARSVDPLERHVRSINPGDLPSSNNEIDNNDVEIHNKRKYYDIHPTKTIDYLHDREDKILTSHGFGDKFSFSFPGEAVGVPRARALPLPGPRIHPTAVQPILATANPRYDPAKPKSTDIQNILTGLVKLLNGNVNIQANTQLLGRPNRPMASRINNRGPPRISDVPPLPPDFDKPITPPSHPYLPTKSPPPYPFDLPTHHGVNLPEQIVPPLNQNHYRPGFHRPIPPWQRPRPRPNPNRRPNPNLPMYKPMPPIPHDIPTLDLPEEVYTKPVDIDDEDQLNFATENESSHSENNIHTVDLDKEPALTTPNILPNITVDIDTEKEDIQKEEETTSSSSTSTTTTSTTTTTTTTTSTTTTPKITTTTEEEKSTSSSTTTTEKPKPEKPVKQDKEKKKDPNYNLAKDKYKLVETEKPVNKNSSESKNATITEIIEPSVTEKPIMIEQSVIPTPTEGLTSFAPKIEEIFNSSILLMPSSVEVTTPSTSQDVLHHPYKPRPGIVLDDTDFKPHGSQTRYHYRPEAPVITAADRHPNPGYGEIFDVTVSAIQGPGEKGGASVHIEAVNPLSGHDHDDIIVSASGEHGFVSIDGKRTYLNLFGDATTQKTPGHTHTIRPTQVQLPQNTVQAHQGVTGVAIPADDIPQRPIARPQRPQQVYKRPQPPVRIDTCIVGDDSTCDQTQNEKCKTELGISSCQCRPGYARRVHRDPCRRVTAFLLSVRVDRLYDRKVAWDIKLADKESEPHQKLSYEALRAVDSAFSMTPFSDEFVSGAVNSVYKDINSDHGVFINYTILMQENAETLRSSVATDIQKHLLGVIRRRSNNIGTSALWVDTPAGSVAQLLDLDECASSDLNDCHQVAMCTNTWGGFRCACPDTTRDPYAGQLHKGGRECISCSPSHCNERGTCKYNNNQPYCSCNSGYYGSTCEVDGEVVGVAVGASLAALLVIALTLACLLSWSRKWSREQKAAGMGSPVFSYMANTIKTPPVGQPPYQVSIEERMRWAQIAEAMAQANHYAETTQHMATRPSSAMFGGYPTLPPVPMPRLGLHMGSAVHHTGTMNTLASRANTTASQANLYGYTNHAASESTSSEASSHVQERADLLVPRPKSRARSMQNQTGIYYDVEYENAPEAIYGSKGIPLSTYTVSRGPPFYRA